MTPARSTQRTAALFVAALLATSCAPVEEVPFEMGHVLVEVERIEFGESPDDPMVGVEYVGERRNGGYIIADRHAGRVRLFDSSGRQAGVVGRPGEGLGELEEPAGAVELPDGRVLVV